MEEENSDDGYPGKESRQLIKSVCSVRTAGIYKRYEAEGIL